MAKDVATKVFDYDGIDKEAKSKLIWLGGEIKRQKDQGLKVMLAMGKAIADAQELLANRGNGIFGKWIEAECAVSRQAAFRYLNAYKTFGKDCNTPVTNLTAEAMYKLSSPSAPASAAKKAKKLAAKGVKVTEKVAEGLLPAKASGKPAKISGGTSFDVKEIESSRKPKSGEQVRDPRLWDRWDNLFSQIRRLADDLNRNSPNRGLHREVVDHLNAAHKAKEQWQQAI